MNDEAPKESLLEFPSKFPIKMMGKDDDEFRNAALQIIEKHAGAIAPDDMRTTPSSNGNFISITVTIDAQSQAQLDEIYGELSAHSAILVAL